MTISSTSIAVARRYHGADAALNVSLGHGVLATESAKEHRSHTRTLLHFPLCKLQKCTYLQVRQVLHSIQVVNEVVRNI